MSSPRRSSQIYLCDCCRFIRCRIRRQPRASLESIKLPKGWIIDAGRLLCEFCTPEDLKPKASES